MEYKVSTGMKVTFILNMVLIFSAAYMGDDLKMAASVIIFVILSVSTEILSAIHEAKE